MITSSITAPIVPRSPRPPLPISGRQPTLRHVEDSTWKGLGPSASRCPTVLALGEKIAAKNSQVTSTVRSLACPCSPVFIGIELIISSHTRQFLSNHQIPYPQPVHPGHLPDNSAISAAREIGARLRAQSIWRANFFLDCLLSSTKVMRSKACRGLGSGLGLGLGLKLGLGLGLGACLLEGANLNL